MMRFFFFLYSANDLLLLKKYQIKRDIERIRQNRKMKEDEREAKRKERSRDTERKREIEKERERNRNSERERDVQMCVLQLSSIMYESS